ncbi:MAG: Gfo/Idh/MocA family oxidoreductase, partial [Phycisphaerales bacterium]|nr:Gfo/Idh/MocA family oxidoreductase [Phycisphaerales bacterium]
MSAQVAWGVLGTGAIAKAFVHGLKQSTTGKAFAVGSRSQETADKFANEHGIERRHGSYEALLADPQVQAVYVSTPHPLHAQWAIKALEAGKHVIVEKPFALNQWEAMAVIDAAKIHKRFLLEAFMYRCHPQTAKLVELIQQKVIGDVRVIQATFSFQAGYNPEGRLFNSSLAGGGIMDVGCYTTSICRLIAGAATGQRFADPVDVKGSAYLGQTGVDEWAVGTLKFNAPQGAILAQIATGVGVNQDNTLRIFGSEGRILVPTPYVANRQNPDIGKIIVHAKGKEVQEITIDANVTSFENPDGLSVVFSVEPIVVRSLQLSGARVLSLTVVNQIFQPQLGQPVDPVALREAVQQINQWYIENGYTLAQVLALRPSPQGVVTVEVAEGVIGNINIRFVNEEGETVDEDGQPIEGRTREDFLRREIQLQPGQVF